jgi:hypothetical protein
LEKIVTKYGNGFDTQYTNDMQAVIQALSMQHKEASKYASKLTNLPLSLEAYNMLRKEEPVAWESVTIPKRYRRERAEIYKLNCFNKQYNEMSQQKRQQVPQQGQTPSRKKTRFTEKVAERAAACVSPANDDDEVMSPAENTNNHSKLSWTKTSLIDAISSLIGTGIVEAFVKSIIEHDGPIEFGGNTYKTEASIYELYNKDGFTGLPPGKEEHWSKEALCNALSAVEIEKGIKMQFLKVKVIESGRSSYRDPSGMTKMYNKWKTNGKDQCPLGVGRPKTASLDVVCAGVNEQIKQGLGNSNMLSYKSVGKVLEEVLRKKAEADGLCPKTVDATVSARTSKRYMIAASLKDEGVRAKLSEKIARDKTLTRWVAENGLQPAVSNCTTTLATHAIEGKRPLEAGGPIEYDKLSDEVKETFDMVREALDADEVYFTHPSLTMNFDASSGFVYEGVVDDDTTKGGDAFVKWKPVSDDPASHSGVHSDYKITDNAGKSGGCRIKSLNTHCASGQMAPVYISVSGLTEEELCPKKCPDGFLAKPVPGLCKGGNDVHSNGGFGWVVFQRAGTKNVDEKFSTASQLFDHYNKYVLLPFIEEARKKLGWVPGLSIPEWMKVVVWCDGEIPALKAMLFPENEKRDEELNIVRNKHPAAGTGVFQACDLCSFFRDLHYASDHTTAKDSTVTGLKQTFTALINGPLREAGLNLDGNLAKKKGLIDIVAYYPEILEEHGTLKKIKKGFVAGGMIDEEHGRYPSFEALMRCCRRWGSTNKEKGTPKHVKDNIRAKMPSLLKIHLKTDQVTSKDMIAADIPRGE